jgi:DNA-binding NarL/FixJ family response regulator
MSIRVVLVDDEAMVRAGLRLILEMEPDVDVAGEASNGAEALAAATELRPDVMLIDVHMPGLDGLSVSRQILAADSLVKVVILTTFNDDAYVREALRLGASGFLLKVAPPERLVEAVRVAAHGDAMLDPQVTRKVIEAFASVPESDAGSRQLPAVLDLLTVREREVLHLLARGMSNAEIAAALVLGDATVKTHVARVLMKLQLRDRVQVVVFAYEHGLVRSGDHN